MKPTLFRLTTYCMLIGLIGCTADKPQQASVRIDATAIQEDIELYQVPLVDHRLFFDGVYFYPFDSVKQKQIELAIDKPILYNVGLKGNAVSLLLQPGDELVVTYQSTTGKPKFQGANMAGQQWLNREEYWPLIYRFRMNMYNNQSDSAFLVAMGKADSTYLLAMTDLKELRESNQIDELFYETAETYVGYYRAQLVTKLCQEVFYQQYHPNRRDPDISIELSPLVDSTWAATYQAFPPANDFMMSTGIWGSYARDYADFYVGTYQVIKAGKYASKIANMMKAAQDKKYLTFSYMQSANSFDEDTLEYYRAYQIYHDQLQKNYEKDLISVFNNFTQDYPKSLYTPYLQPLIDEVVAYHEKVNGTFEGDVSLVDSVEVISQTAEVNSFSDLVTMVQKGKPLFIDVWATWCGPCKREFKHKEALYAFLEENNIQAVYISIDKERNHDKWKEMLAYYELKGIHIRTNEKFHAQLVEQYDKFKEGISIPWYMFVDKDGNLTEKYLPAPSEGDVLFNRMRELL